MSLDQYSPEELIARFSYQSQSLIHGMVCISKPAEISKIQRNDGTSSAGALDSLPLELLHSICASLDFQSLSRLSRTSIRSKAIVESLPAYRDLMKYAPGTLNALGKTGLISVHSSTTLHAALRSENCVSCGEYGAFLFMPTCGRICYLCLKRNATFWVISTRQARKYFNLTERQIKLGPIMHNILGYYLCGSRRQRVRLISVGDAKKIAIMVHGSEEKLGELVLPQPPSTLFWHEMLRETRAYQISKWLIEAPLDPIPYDPLTIPRDSDQPDNVWLGTASIHFPSISPQKTLENGLWCLGCKCLCQFSYHLDSGTLSRLIPTDIESWYYLDGLHDRARSKASFLEHIRKCYGVEMLNSASGDTTDVIF